MQDVTITSMPRKGEDERGFVQEWKFDDGHQITVLSRKKGGHFGHHSHTGADPSKDPERFFVLEGRVKVTWWDANNEKREAEMKGGDEILIPKDVPHCFDSLEDCWFLEYRVNHFDPSNVDAVEISSGLCDQIIHRDYDAK